MGASKSVKKPAKFLIFSTLKKIRGLKNAFIKLHPNTLEAEGLYRISVLFMLLFDKSDHMETSQNVTEYEINK